MKWIDRPPIKGFLYEDPEIIIFELDRAARSRGPNGSLMARIWRSMVANLRESAFAAHSSASQMLRPQSSHRPPSAHGHSQNLKHPRP